VPRVAQWHSLRAFGANWMAQPKIETQSNIVARFYFELKLFNNSSGVVTAVPALPTTMPAA
jgi:hypothetical protein